MAARYVYSGAAGSGTGADWANAHTTLAAAITASSAGDTFYVAHDHSQNYGSSTTLTFKGTRTNPDTILCVNRAGSVPPVAADLTTGALEGTNAASTNINVAGSFYMYGMTFAPGSGQSTTCSLSVGSASAHTQTYDNCRFRLLSTGTGSNLNAGNSTNRSRYINCRVKFAATAQKISLDGGADFFGDGSDILEVGSSIPTTLFSGVLNANVLVTGCDLSSISGTVAAAVTSTGTVGHRFVNCKLHASATLGATPSYDSGQTEFYGCHSSGNVAREAVYRYAGTLTTEQTIVRTGGSSNGTTAFSHKIVTTANARRFMPFFSLEGAIWNSATGSSKTLTVHTVTDNVTLTDAEIWLEVDYLGSSGAPISTRSNDANATVLTTAANQASSTETWTTTGLATPVKQKLEVTFTPQMAGPIRWRVCVAKASTTVYVCPKAELS